MVGGNIKKTIIFLSLIFITIFFLTNRSLAEGIVKGEFVENIDGVDHIKIIQYGPSGVYTLEEMLKKIGLELNTEDQVKVFPDPKLGIGSKIQILRATNVIVKDSGNIKTYRTWSKTINEFLTEKEIALGKDDVMDKEDSMQLTDNLEINITRVSLQEVKEYEDIEYGVIYRDDPTLERGLTKVAQSPSFGKKELTYMVRYEDGDEIYKNLVNEEIVEEPVDKIVLEGTKVTVLGSGTATWYDWISGMTAASNQLAYGTKVLVRNNANGKEVVVTIVDHGIQGSAIIDLSADAFSKIGNLGAGVISVTLEKP